jgi:hypothetical protein
MARIGRPREIFLSHSSRDGRQAKQIAARLGKFGLNVWFAPSNLRGAQAWHDEIGRALRRCDWFVVLLTPAAVRSRWVKRELVFAFSERRFESRIVPVKLQPCNLDSLSWVLRSIEQVDVSREPNLAAEKIAALWGSTRKRNS